MKNLEAELSKRSRNRLSAPTLAQWCAVVATLLVVGPMLWSALYAPAYSFGVIGLFNRGATFEYWQTVFTSGSLLDSVLFSARMALCATTLAISASIGLLLISPNLRHSRILGALAIIAMGTPAAVLGLMTMQTLSRGGLLSRIAFQFGMISKLEQFPELTQDRFGAGILIALAISQFPLAWLYFTQLWNTAKIDRLCQQAEFLGATAWQARTRVALRVLLTRGRSMIILLFLLGLGSYELPYLLGRQSPQMFSVLTQRRFGQYDLHDRPEAFAIATIYFLFASLLLTLFVYWKKRDA